ncbi:anthranilate O-methyltransferase 3-like isoform X2 [Asparagus officinalis]|uniref:anthranilate O-methyltransferase 3-like isoform X2 n=1 Tax=Asparagus officinalis TaxID=4686 RepID=UPI00098E3E23|nr:anthranilate O-methyltransferase 3-like isoform X2 [Asparagus officinalis]
MEVAKILHMVGGVGETSYALNSTLQKKAMHIAKPIVQQSISQLYCKLQPTESLTIADLGCSCGPTTFITISEIMDEIYEVCHRLSCQVPELTFFLNDLPGNDFNSIFKYLPTYDKMVKKEKGSKYAPYYVVGVPGSFYGRLLPEESIHFVHSSYSLHWLSQGVVDKEKVDAFDLPLYAPAIEEVKELVQNEGSFEFYQAKVFELNWDPFDDQMDDFVADSFVSGENAMKTIRAVMEPMLANHFGGAVMDALFSRYAMNVAEHLKKEKTKYVNFTVALTKRG